MSATYESILQTSYALAARLNHELVTLEHVLAVLIEDVDVIKLLTDTKSNIDALRKENSDWLSDTSKHVIVKPGIPVRHTTHLANLFRKAKTHSIFKEQNQIGSIDLLISMYGIEESPASFFLQKHTVGREALLEYINGLSALSPDSQLTANEANEILKTYCVNLNERAKNGKIDQLIGREKEVESITQILARRTKHNCVITGQPGVGKSVLVEGLAKKIVDNEVPEILKTKIIWSLDIASLVAGTKFRGDFEERMKNIILALKSSPEAIVFIDEIHMIMGAGSGGGGNGALDAANILKPALSRGEIRCIGCTTEDEYRKHFEKDRALVRRFQRLDVNEPSIEDSKKILRGITKYYEKYHGVTYTDDAIDSAVELTARYIHDKQLPDKAIDIIDSSAAWQKIKPVELQKLVIDKQDIEFEVGRVTKIPVSNVKDDESIKLKNLSPDLHKAIYGQDTAIDTLTESIYLSKSGLREHDKTIGSYLFVGPTGSGKTALVKQLAKTLGIELIRFDMSEYQESHKVSALLGSPPGYIGYGDGQAGSGLLINAIEKHPHCVLLLDEIEKAHPDIFNILLQVMDHGTLTSSQGKTVNMRNVILVMTSNLGAADMAKESIGFKKPLSKDHDTIAINNFFTPEFRNRLDAIVSFNSLTKENMSKIVDKFIAELSVLTSVKNINIIVDDKAKEWLIEKGFDKLMGARPLSRVIDTNIKKPLSKEILFGKLKNGGTVNITVNNSELHFEYSDLSDLSNLINEIAELDKVGVK